MREEQKKDRKEKGMERRRLMNRPKYYNVTTRSETRYNPRSGRYTAFNSISRDGEG
jgi:hypothetical protein